LRGFLKLSDAESVNFHCVPNQVLYQAEPLPDKTLRTSYSIANVRSTTGNLEITLLIAGKV